MASRKAVVLLSGGLDSATTLYLAKKQGYDCFCLIFDYGQRHAREIKSAKAIAQRANCKWQIIKINLPWKGSSLLDKNIIIPRRDNETTRQRYSINLCPCAQYHFFKFCFILCRGDKSASNIYRCAHSGLFRLS